MSDLVHFFNSSTVPHLAAFILPSPNCAVVSLFSCHELLIIHKPAIARACLRHSWIVRFGEIQLWCATPRQFTPNPDHEDVGVASN
jgi:hypothetical protein